MKNNTKKKILVIAPHMKMGGSPISLIRLLKYLDFNKVEVTLLLMKRTGILLNEIPSNVIVKEIKFHNEMANLLAIGFQKTTLIQRIKRKIFRKLLNVRSANKKNAIYEYCLNNVESEVEKYDLAIDYHGYGYFTTAYAAKKVIAEKKAMWIHDEKMDFLKKVSPYLNDFNKFFGVAKSCVRIFKDKYPQLSERADTFYNIIDVDDIISKSKDKIYIESIEGGFKIVTVGRLVEQKGYDMAINAAKIIKDSGYNFKWYVIGDGELREELEKEINEKGLSNYFVLLGLKSNPFPYIKMADLYVQPSRHEGYGLAISEARVLNKPIISTKIECITEQLNHGVNGYLVDFDEADLAKNIIYLIENPDKMDALIKKLQQESSGNLDEINKIYSLII